MAIATALQTRPLFAREFADAAAIDAAGYPFIPWTAKRFEVWHEASTRNFSLAAQRGSADLAGYVCYRVGDGALHIERLAVAPTHRRHGVARRLIQRVAGTLSPTWPILSIVIEPVRVDGWGRRMEEGSEAGWRLAQFLRACGFVEGPTIRHAFDVPWGLGTIDGVHFERRYGKQ